MILVAYFTLILIIFAGVFLSINVCIFSIKIELIFDEDEAFYQSEISSSDLEFLFWFFTNYM